MLNTVGVGANLTEETFKSALAAMAERIDSPRHYSVDLPALDWIESDAFVIEMYEAAKDNTYGGGCVIMSPSSHARVLRAYANVGKS